MGPISFCFLALAMLSLGLWVASPALAQDKELSQEPAVNISRS